MQKHLLYVAMDVDEVVGFVAIKHKNNHVSEILWMTVKKERQKQGIGSALIDHIVNDLRAQGIRLLEVKTLSDDVNYPLYEITRHFYEVMGFMYLETIDPYPGWDQGNSCAIYVKIL
ncbi:GNAT family N-acetyltransferase [Anoxybacter fermentans]|uniref:GNAT family N-acetyltransferase n=1 Tax=Anoxybacter fermentans TaxID=1323375 RepID=UPI00214FD943|nr:GNAT family N-acetyltransferase [Anoxybacter fermentans]